MCGQIALTLTRPHFTTGQFTKPRYMSVREAGKRYEPKVFLKSAGQRRHSRPLKRRQLNRRRHADIINAH